MLHSCWMFLFLLVCFRLWNSKFNLNSSSLVSVRIRNRREEEIETAQTQTPSKPKPTSPAQQPNPAQQTNPRPNSPLFLHSLRRGPLFSPSHHGPASSEFRPFPPSPTLFLSPAARAPFGPLSTRARPATQPARAPCHRAQGVSARTSSPR